uniref:Uncharacterized protein n=1 Tax=Pipistrellus kuhlii TaxID=59472 RepID=A0A7J7QUK4_PIPKU|nr:hypothetical protein mPipKuh1_008356 [Pipistrellus kuhlii]
MLLTFPENDSRADRGLRRMRPAGGSRRDQRLTFRVTGSGGADSEGRTRGFASVIPCSRHVIPGGLAGSTRVLRSQPRCSSAAPRASPLAAGVAAAERAATDPSVLFLERMGGRCDALPTPCALSARPPPFLPGASPSVRGAAVCSSPAALLGHGSLHVCFMWKELADHTGQRRDWQRPRGK